MMPETAITAPPALAPPMSPELELSLRRLWMQRSDSGRFDNLKAALECVLATAAADPDASRYAKELLRTLHMNT